MIQTILCHWFCYFDIKITNILDLICIYGSIFDKLSFTKFFRGGIFGNPDSKEYIINREILSNNIVPPVVLFGDSEYDYFCAQKYGFDFVFVSGWSELKSWKDFVELNQLPSICSLSDLLQAEPTPT